MADFKRGELFYEFLEIGGGRTGDLFVGKSAELEYGL